MSTLRTARPKDRVWVCDDTTEHTPWTSDAREIHTCPFVPATVAWLLTGNSQLAIKCFPTATEDYTCVCETKEDHTAQASLSWTVQRSQGKAVGTECSSLKGAARAVFEELRGVLQGMCAGLSVHCLRFGLSQWGVL